MTTPILESHRVRLRPWRETDLPAFAAINADPAVMEFFPSVLDREQSDALAHRIRDHFDLHGFGLWALEIKQDAPFAGFVGLAIPGFEARFTPCVEIGWRLSRDHQGHGYATEAARLAMGFGYRELALDEIVSFTSRLNTRSIRVMQRLGMTHDAADDFAHPALPAPDPLSDHVLYRAAR